MQKKNYTFTLPILLIVLIQFLFLSTGCDVQLYEPVKPVVKETPEPVEEPVVEEEKPFEYAPIETNTEITTATSVEELLASLTLEEKVAQLFIVDFYNMTAAYQEKEYDESMDTFLRQYPVGGVIYFAENIESANQVMDLNTALSTVSQIPLFISVDEEGGIVSRLGNANIGVTHLDDAATLASENTADDIYAKALKLGNEINVLGFNMDFAPVLDINTNAENPIIGKRAFGSDAETVTTYSVAFYNGLSDAGIIATGKHFPGHGDTLTDSHTQLTSVDHDLKRLQSMEFIPFESAIEENIPAIMVAHINTPNVTTDGLPSSLSKEMITQQLREGLGFDGLVISDSFRMKAITDYYTSADVGVMFLNAGGDLILLPDDFAATYTGILDAVTNGTITQERIDESVRRILAVKEEYGLITFPEN